MSRLLIVAETDGAAIMPATLPTSPLRKPPGFRSTSSLSGTASRQTGTPTTARRSSTSPTTCGSRSRSEIGMPPPSFSSASRTGTDTWRAVDDVRARRASSRGGTAERTHVERRDERRVGG